MSEVKLTQPATQKKAQDLADQLGAPVDDAERDRVFQYRAQPFLTALDKTQDQFNRQMEQAGLRFSSDRYTGLQENVANTWKQIGESVMVPQIEREKTDLREDIGLLNTLGATEFQQNLATAEYGLAQRRQQLDETNAALDRAIKQGQATGTFTDPVTGATSQTLEAQKQQFEQGITERMTRVDELNGAVERARAQGDATGIYVDPVSGQQIETLQSKANKLNERVQAAIYTGYWEDDATLNREWLELELGINTADYVEGGGNAGNGNAGNGNAGGGADDTTDANTVAAGQQRDAENLVASSQRTAVAQTTGLDSGRVSALEQVYGDQWTAFHTAVTSGAIRTWGDLAPWVDPNRWGGFTAFSTLSTVVVVDDPTVQVDADGNLPPGTPIRFRAPATRRSGLTVSGTRAGGAR